MSPELRVPARMLAVFALLFSAALAMGDDGVTPASGTSWVTRRGLVMIDASFGRLGDLGATGGRAPVSPPWPWPQLPERWLVTGADLYRFDCRSCHNSDGTGLPPEINSLLDPVRATSAAYLRQRMAERGRTMDARTARQLAAQAEGNIHLRLQNGGQKMPAFPHLRPAEIDALLAHLGRLANVPPAAPSPVRLVLSASQVGQHVVKGTCLICHDAAGPGSSASRDGTPIPSLATLVQSRTLPQVIAKVHTGSVAGERRGEMPQFPYLSDEEIGTAYLYLLRFPPVAAH